MGNRTYPGICSFCNGAFTKKIIIKHLETCKEKLTFDLQFENKEPYKFFSILIESPYNSTYWILIEASSILTLDKLDAFLRDIWLECCEHLSAFSQKGSEIKMNRRLYDVLNTYPALDYEYDFGSTTELKIKTIKQFESKNDKPIRVVAMNVKPEIECSVCEENQAVGICDFCYEEILCEDCAKTHKCFMDEGEISMSKMINSPRSGVCGYTGPDMNLMKKYFPKDNLYLLNN